MNRIRQLLLVGIVICALPLAAQAQWAYDRVEHDWRLSIGGHSFGLVQKAVYTVNLTQPTFRQTTICFGSFGSMTTFQRAPFVAAVMALPVAAAGTFLLMILLRRKTEPSLDRRQ